MIVVLYFTINSANTLRNHVKKPKGYLLCIIATNSRENKVPWQSEMKHSPI